MSKLDSLMDWLDGVEHVHTRHGKVLHRECKQELEALRKHIEELERECPNGHPASLIHCITEWAGPNSAQDAPEHICEMCELQAKLQRYRKLAELMPACHILYHDGKFEGCPQQECEMARELIKEGK